MHIGGTALALRIGHRISYDLDFFTAEDFNRNIVIQKLIELGFKLEKESWGTILGTINSTKFSLFYYKYPLIDKSNLFMKIDIVGLKDLSAMKINAVSSRGTKRDFVDIYFLAKHFSLKEMLQHYDQKFATLHTNQVHIIKSLCYFVDADGEPDPTMLGDVFDWNQIKKFFIEESKKLI